jgi:glyoxylase-like metal-dependent hydrolase (beta-lactamase superfamily II)
VIVERSMDSGWLSNAYIVGDEEGGTAVAIDSGAPLQPLFDALERHRLTLQAVLCTHRHGDHVSGNSELIARTGAEIYSFRDEAAYISGARPLDDGEECAWGGLKVKVIHLPGHTSGQCGFLILGVGLFTGDCLFKGSLGGTVGPASSGFDDARMAVERILTLPDETPIYPGHADATTVGHEKKTSPLVRAMTGADPKGDTWCKAAGRPARLIALANDYDGGTKGWVRFDDGTNAIVPGSRLEL